MTQINNRGVLTAFVLLASIQAFMDENTNIITVKSLLKFAESMIMVHAFPVKYHEIKTMLFANNPEEYYSGDKQQDPVRLFI
ncbi:hypothetical protein [Ferroplasma sp. Type II]|uniref:hypothetical protein n=1 Tax=Ferroplasma sp. Type II TaxID=261388 RepID=UPI0025C7411F|nr:hypothetical protein [Ferroplasma sp. Type II]